MRVGWLCAQVVNLLFLTEWTLCGVLQLSRPQARDERTGSYPRRRLLGAGGGAPYPVTGPSQNPDMGRAPRRPAGIPHMWSERQHNQRLHAHAHDNKQHDHPPLDPGAAGQEEPTGETHTTTFDHVQEGASHSGRSEVTRQQEQNRKEDLTAQKLHRTGGINDILKRPGMDPEITGDANLSLYSVMRLAAMNLTELIAADRELLAGSHASNLTERQLRRKLRQRLSVTDTRQQLKHGRSRYSLVTTRVRTRAKRSDADLGDDYTWAVIVGGSGLSILIVVMCACVCARCSIERKQTEALTMLPTEAPQAPAVFFVGGTHVGSESASASGGARQEAGVDNSGFALGDLASGCGGAEGGLHHQVGCHMAAGRKAAGPSTSTFGYSALKDDEDCVSLRSSTLEMEKS